jgi:hypothetical protein
MAAEGWPCQNDSPGILVDTFRVASRSTWVYVFLARAIEEIGRTIFPEDGNGKEVNNIRGFIAHNS